MEIMFQENRSCQCVLQNGYSEKFHKIQYKSPVPGSHFSKVSGPFEEHLWATTCNDRAGQMYLYAPDRARKKAGVHFKSQCAL